MAEKCEICGKELQLINENHLRIHGVTLEEYRQKFGGGKGKIRKISTKLNSKSSSNNKNQLTHQSVRTLEELYELDKKLVVPKKFIRVTEENKELLNVIKEMAFDYKSIVIDLETTGLNPFYDIITDVVITINKEPTYGHNYHIPMLHVDRQNKLVPGQLQVSFIREWIEPILRAKEIEKNFHSALFDCMMLWEVWGIRVRNIAFDTRLVGKLLNENEREHSLKHLYWKYCQPTEEDEEIKALGVETYEEQFSKIKFFRVPMNVATCYAAKDGYMTRRLREFQEPYLETVGRLKEVYTKIERPLIQILMNMRKEGIILDLERARELDNILAEELKETEDKLRAVLGDINLGSPKQLSEKLFRELKLPNIYKNSTKKEALEELAGMGYEVPRLILDFRGKEKLRSTYTGPAEIYIQEKTGRVHTNFDAGGTVTGRFSSNNPNLQNLPARTDKRIRTMFMVEPGYVFISKDYSQIEPKVLAHLSQDPIMLNAYRKGEDIYSSMASEVYSAIEGRKISIEECGDGSTYRTNMKTILLGIMYNMSNIGLARKLKIDKEQAQDIIDAFYEKFRGVAKYERELKKFCREEGYVETIYGRKRRLPDIWNEEWWIRKKTERQVLNSVIQGSSADIIKRAMIEIGYDKRIWELGGKLLLTVHDELDSKAPIENTVEASKLMVEAMLRVWDLSVPMQVDVDLYYDRRWFGKKVTLNKENKEKDLWVLRHKGQEIDEEQFIHLCMHECS